MIFTKKNDFFYKKFFTKKMIFFYKKFFTKFFLQK